MWLLGRAGGSVVCGWQGSVVCGWQGSVVCGWHLEGGSFLLLAAQVRVWSGWSQLSSAS